MRCLKYLSLVVFVVSIGVFVVSWSGVGSAQQPKAVKKHSTILTSAQNPIRRGNSSRRSPTASTVHPALTSAPRMMTFSPNQPVAQVTVAPSPFGVSFQSAPPQSTPAKPAPSLFERVVQGIPPSATDVEALVRARYSIPESTGKAFAEVLALADGIAETTVGVNELTITSTQKTHAAVSNFVSTFLSKNSQAASVSRPPQAFGNVPSRTVSPGPISHASYESPLPPKALGFAPSAQNVQLLLRAAYPLPTEKAKLIEDLLKIETRLVLETKFISETPSGNNSESNPKSTSTHHTSTLVVTTTRAGQLAVAGLIEAIYKDETSETEIEKDAEPTSGHDAAIELPTDEQPPSEDDAVGSIPE